MSCLQSPRLSDDDLLSSPSSDEKMDTASESFRCTQHTPSSTPDVDHEDDVLRLQHPNIIDTDQILDNKVTKLKSELNDSFISRFTTLTLSSPDNKARNIGISTPKYSSTLTLTTNHPLMGLASPDEDCPVTKKTPRTEEDKDLSLSSIEDDRGTTNRYEFYTPQRNTSKNNLYFSENYVTADSQFLSESLNIAAEAKDQHQKRIIIPRFLDTPVKDTAQQNLSVFLNSGREERDVKTYKEERGERTALDVIDKEDFHSGVCCYEVEYRESPPRAVPSFDLPIEMSSNIGLHNGVESPDLESLSTQEDRSAYQALLDPYTGSVALRHTTHRSNPPRRKVQLPPEEDECSLDSVSGGSLESEDEPPAVESVPDPHSEDDTKRSKSTNTLSECSDPIPEYSAAEEFREERSWLSVTHGGGRAVCDMKVIEPFKRVVSHGGYEEGGAALIVFSACHLPDTRRPDYRYVMDNLFLYVMWSLERLVTDEYVLVYLHGSAGRRRMPTFAWLHECYKLVDRRLRKSLKRLYLVHPTFWLKSFVVITKPFVSYKFFRKLSYVESLKELFQLVPVEPNAIPDLVKEYDDHKKK